MTDQEINNPADLRRWRTELPNMYDDAGLSPYEFRLLAHYVRVGNCWESLRTTADKCKMSKTQVGRARDSLVEKGFIAVEHRYKDGSVERDTTVITVIDRWSENFAIYGGQNGGVPHRDRVSLEYNGGVPGGEGGVPVVVSKNKPIKNKPIEEEESRPPPPVSVPKVLTDASGLATFPADQLEWVEVVHSLLETYGAERTTAAMRKACAAWVKTVGKNGREYKRTNLAWINWAQEELAGGSLPAKHPEKMTDDEWRAHQFGQVEVGPNV